MDGAGSWQRFKTVTLPFLRPAMLPFAIYGFVITFNLFYLLVLHVRGRAVRADGDPRDAAYRLVQERHLFGVAAAFAIFQFFILLAITLVTNRLARATASYDSMTRRRPRLPRPPVRPWEPGLMTTPAIVAPSIKVKSASRARQGSGRPLKPANQIVLQLACLAIGATVLFPIVWIVGMSLDPRNISRPDSLIPPGANLDAYARVLAQPDAQPRLVHRTRPEQPDPGRADRGAQRRARHPGGVRVLAAEVPRPRVTDARWSSAVLMLPAVATIGPLYIILNQFRSSRRLSTSARSLLGRRPGRDLDPAALRDLEHEGLPRHDPEGARGGGRRRWGQQEPDRSHGSSCRWRRRPRRDGLVRVHRRLDGVPHRRGVRQSSDPSDWTLAIALNSMVGQFARSTPWSTVRRVRGPVRAAGVGRLLPLPALPRRRPGGRRGQGLSSAGPGLPTLRRGRVARARSNHGFVSTSRIDDDRRCRRRRASARAGSRRDRAGRGTRARPRS